MPTDQQIVDSTQYDLPQIAAASAESEAEMQIALEGAQHVGRPAGTEPTEMQLLFDKLVPELAGNYASITPDVREGILLKKLAAIAESKPPAIGAATQTAGGLGAGPGAPPVEELPPVNFDQVMDGLKTYCGSDEEAQLLAKALRPFTDYLHRIGAITVRTIQEQASRLQQFDSSLKDLTLPGQIKAALARVPGAIEADVPAAKRLLEEQKVSDIETALKVAAMDRRSLLEPAPAASDESRRRAEAMLAAGISRPNVSGGHYEEPIPTTEAQMIEHATRRARAQRGGRG